MLKPWRLYLANSAIQHLDIIYGQPDLLAVWTRDGKVAYYDLEKGAAHGTSAFALPEKREEYWPFILKLKDSKDRKLAFARVGGMSFWTLEDGGVLEYFGGKTIELFKNAEDMPQTLTFDVKPTALAVDAQTKLVAVIDMKGALLLGQPGGTIKTLKPGLTPADDLPLSLAMARGGKRIVVSDGTRIIVIDNGKVSHRRELHYACGMLALSPDGKTLLVFDADSGVLRSYNPDGIQLTHQRFIVDLLSASEELQLIAFAELPPVSAALSALTINNDGRFAFAVFGQICAASLSHLSPTLMPPAGGKSMMPANAEAVISAEKPAPKPSSVTGGTPKPAPAARPAPKPAAAKTPKNAPERAASTSDEKKS